MNPPIDKELIQTLVAEVEPFWHALPMGYMEREIQEFGFFEEAGLKITSEDVYLGQFYIGLSVLARDMHLYLAEHPRTDAALFHEVISSVNAAEAKKYGEQAFPDYGGNLPQAQVAALPTGLAAAAAAGNPTLTPLRDNPQIVHEWTFKPGKRLFEHFIHKFGHEFKEVICGPGGPYEQFQKGDQLLNQSELPVLIVSSILSAGFSPATFWVPLAVYISLLLIKTGLKAFCETD